MRERMRILRRPRRRRWRRWAEGFDPWHPRPGDYVVAAIVFLALALLYIGERTYAVQLNRRIFQLEERVAGLRDGEAVLATQANTLADRGRVMRRAEHELGLVVPAPGAFSYIYYVPPEGGREAGLRIGAQPRPSRGR
jgi:hypothetical protein